MKIKDLINLNAELPVLMDMGDVWVPVTAEIREGETSEGMKKFVILKPERKNERAVSVVA